MAIFKKNGLIRIISVLLTVSLMAPGYANAAVAEPIQPMSSDYVDWRAVGISTPGDGKLEVWFDVWATGIMDEVGAMSIRLYESADQTTWKRVMTCLYEDWPSMMGGNSDYYSSHMDYQGVAGKYYKAYIKIWAGKDGDGDYEFLWPPIVQAA